MNPGAAIFGTTILGKGETPNLMARKLMSFYNDKQVFSNLERALRDRFSGVSLELVGEEALFSARLA